MNSTQSEIPSYVTLPKLNAKGSETILSFLSKRFPRIDKETWAKRICSHKVLDDNNTPITLETPYKSHMKLTYYREVVTEKVIPFEGHTLFENDHMLIYDKPHFLPVTPSGQFVNESLLNRLKHQTGNMDLTPVHRLDRETAGVILFSKRKETRGEYHDLFLNSKVTKIYEALATPPKEVFKKRIVETRIFEGDPFFLMTQSADSPNSKTTIELIDLRERYARFKLTPETGRKHQLRLHLAHIGCPILNDKYYPTLQPESEDDFGAPLKLLARELKFNDPITGIDINIKSQQAL